MDAIDRRQCKDVKCNHNLNGRCCLYNLNNCVTYKENMKRLKAEMKKTK